MHLSSSAKKGEAQIEVHRGKRYKASDYRYNYDIGICISAIDATDYGRDVGVLHVSNKTGISKVIGRISDADIMAGPNWVLLEYNNGDKYSSHCMMERRRARIMLICDPSASDEIATVLDQENDKTGSCDFLFLVNTAAVCKSNMVKKERYLGGEY